MRFAFVLGVALLGFVHIGCQSSKPALLSGPGVVPPPMPRRAIAPSTQPLPGIRYTIVDRNQGFVLFVPRAWRPPANGQNRLTLHFHATEWFVIDEHLRRGLANPLLIAYLGEGSTVYREAFSDPKRLAELIAKVEANLIVHGAPKNTRITMLDISSFSAGYGAVRELVKSGTYRQMIDRIVLSDSMYGGWDQATTRPGSTSRPATENIEPWIPFAKAAARGKKIFVLTYSQVPTSYANSEVCAVALGDAVGVPRVAVPKGSLPATLDPEFPLLYRADQDGFHLWGYGGTDAQAHITHARHLADVWMAIDAKKQE